MTDRTERRTSQRHWLPGMRDPSEETEDYPGLIVRDGRRTGSLTAGHSRMPMSTVCTAVMHGDFDQWANGEDNIHGVTVEDAIGFVHDLLEHRGDFARLLAVLADVQRLEWDRQDEDMNLPSWWDHDESYRRVHDALVRCLDALDNMEVNPSPLQWEKVGPGLQMATPNTATEQPFDGGAA